MKTPLLIATLLLAASAVWAGAAERRAAFTAQTSIDDERVLTLYEAADTDHDSQLSWDELAAFTHASVVKYKYRDNKGALWPQEFLDQGGGVCEDWAGVTAGLCLYWGREAYIAGFGKVTKNKHALVLVQADAQASPYWLTYYGLRGFAAVTDPDARFIPVDYDSIGHLVAIDRRWKIAHIWTAQEVWGQPVF